VWLSQGGSVSTRQTISKYLPILSWISQSSPRADIIAGIAVAGLLVPEGMAYAGIAGVPPQMGLYAAMQGMFVYALFGTSRQLAVTSTSSSAALLALRSSANGYGGFRPIYCSGIRRRYCRGTYLFTGRHTQIGDGFRVHFQTCPQRLRILPSDMQVGSIACVTQGGKGKQLQLARCCFSLPDIAARNA
jgi:hypothetical protein